MENNFKIINFENIASTSQKAKELVVEKFEPWTVVVAKEQSLGHGRKGESWFSPIGGLYFSVILPKSNIDDLQTITNLAAFVVAQILKDGFGLQPLIKLPNDILIKEKKVCGILTENVIIGQSPVFSIIGIGLNTNIKIFPEELEDKATSLQIELNQEFDNNKILEKILIGLKKQLEIISQ
jgi:BirA family biotin operon repressor/biotin-[acetyl-CoA-carboxylase] ligase